MTWRRAGALAYLGLAALGVLAILGFYAQRLTVPLPLFAADEAAYLLHALYPDDVVARNPYVASAVNGLHLSAVRAVVLAGGDVVIGDRILNLAAYLLGLLALWWVSVKRTPVTVPGELGLALLLLAVGFSYYRFAASNLAEGLFVGVFVAFALVFRRWWRSRPVVQALLGGALGAALVLTKPNGLAEIGALFAVGLIDAWLARDWARLPVRVIVFALSFFLAGNLIQWQSDVPIREPWAFFLSSTYGAQLQAATPANGLALGLLGVLAMGSASAVLAGAPAVVGLADLLRRAQATRFRLEIEGGDLAFLLILASLAGTVAMVGAFTMKVAATPGETYRLWGRYFEFFVPLIWLSAAPALSRGIGPKTAATASVVTFAGLAGLLVSFKAGILLLPWDAGVMTAFFQPDPTRAPLSFALPVRALSILAVLLSGAAYAARLRPAFVGLGLILALSGLSTWLDGAWLGPMARSRTVFAQDLTAIAPRLPPAGKVSFLSSDANETHLAFLVLEARPKVIVGPPAQAPADDLAGAVAAIVSGRDAPPAGPWLLAYKGEAASLYRRPAGAVAAP